MYKWNLIIYDKNRIMKVMIYIISLCNKIHGGEIYMFQNERFCTCGVNEEVPIVLQCMMWNMVDTMEVESKDYFQKKCRSIKWSILLNYKVLLFLWAKFM